jgi:hypothetical protein
VKTAIWAGYDWMLREPAIAHRGMNHRFAGNPAGGWCLPQKPYFTPNCMIRGVPSIDVIRPNAPELKFVCVRSPPCV